ncbi:alpha-keto acid decarboxylase family protein [Nostoc sp. ChiQUE01b]|uniref:alpha-keto acid decarboxylase family protein n=1 Tax=Nostoc sp. ChiQUE01b TaxID=3075376 RepID=UPI002AD32C2C|nr:thiamine pyrophosphate-binding protein [Nostoc sp. ChiQUE01b]MDZ8259908.1 thiamine pyrophosphate-binding protein [Nostoc sp. ChiQUE01b]
MSTQYTVNSYLLDRLKELGIRHIFGVPGDYAFPLMDRMETTEDISWIGNCNELNGAYAADGYARIHGIGAFVVTCGVGELSAACGVAGAYNDQVPLIAIVGHPPKEGVKTGLTTHHGLRGDFSGFARIYKEFTVAQALLTPENACQEIDRVFEACWSEKLPVYVQLPRDVGDLPAQPPTAKLALSEPVSDPKQLTVFLESLLPLLSAAQRPAMLVDVWVGSFHLTELVESFASKSGIPFAATPAAKSAFLDETHPQYLGTYPGEIEGNAVSQQIKEADLLLRLAIHYDETNTGRAAFNLRSPEVVNLQINSAAIGESDYPNLRLRDVLMQLNEKVDHREFAFSKQARTTSVAFEPQHDTPITQERLWQRFGHFLQSDDVLVIDQGMCFGATMVTIPAGARIVTLGSWGAIGYALPAVLGAHLADNSRRHLLVLGDGAFQMTAQELSTILRHELNPIIILLHNNRYEIENVYRLDGYKEMHYNELQSWNYHQLLMDFAQTQEPLGLKVTTESELETAFTKAAQAQTEGRCVLIEVILAPNDVPSYVADSFNIGLERQRNSK